MAEMVQDLKALATALAVVVSVGFIDVLGIIVLIAFKPIAATLTDNISSEFVNNTIDLFDAGLAIVGAFIGLIVLAIMAKIVISVFRAS